MHLTSVDLPAPLSPTSAITSPRLDSKSTDLSTLTGPKLLSMPRIRRITSSGIGQLLHCQIVRLSAALQLTASGRPPHAADDRPPTVELLDAGRRALGDVGAGARTGLRGVAVVDRIRDVVLRDRDRRGQDRRHLATGLGVLDRLRGLRDTAGGEGRRGVNRRNR